MGGVAAEGGGALLPGGGPLMLWPLLRDRRRRRKLVGDAPSQALEGAGCWGARRVPPQTRSQCFLGCRPSEALRRPSSGFTPRFKPHLFLPTPGRTTSLCTVPPPCHALVFSAHSALSRPHLGFAESWFDSPSQPSLLFAFFHVLPSPVFVFRFIAPAVLCQADTTFASRVALG